MRSADRQQLLLVPAIVLALLASSSDAGVRDHAKIGLHLVPRDTLSSACESAPLPPCNEGEWALNVQGEVGEWYTLYLMILDADPVLKGVQGATFGITYDPSIQVEQWVGCEEGVEIQRGFMNEVWPDSGSGIHVLWDECRSTEVEADEDRGITAIIGSFDVFAKAPGAIKLTPKGTGRGSYAVTDCSGRSLWLEPKFAGAVAFGDSKGSYDPCKGPFSDYSEFESIDPTELKDVQIKLTTHFEIFDAGASTVITPGYFQAIGYHPFYRPGYSYMGDLDPMFVRVTSEEMESIIQYVGLLPEIRRGGVDPQALLSLSMKWLQEDGITIMFDRTMNSENGTTVFAAILKCLDEESPARKPIEQFACGWLMFPTDLLPSEVTDQVEVTLTPNQLVADINTFSLKLVVRNIGKVNLPAPLSVLIETAYENDLIDPTGKTCGLTPLTSVPFVDLPIEMGLAPGDVVSVDLLFQYPEDEEPRPPDPSRIKVYAGKGVR